MIAYIKVFLEYRKYNIIFSRMFGIKRDLRLELYLLRNIMFFVAYDKSPNKERELKKELLEEKLRKRCRGYLEHYNKKSQVSFKDLDYIACRILASYMISHNEDELKKELKNNEMVADCFCRSYLERRVEEGLKSFQHNEISLDNKIRAVN